MKTTTVQRQVVESDGIGLRCEKAEMEQPEPEEI